MNQNRDYKTRFIELKCCVIIPTYNNAGTIGKVISELLTYTDRIIVVNDGSTDSTVEILSGFSLTDVISYAENKGKGFAIRKGFERAITNGNDYAITIDSDGQHDVADIPAFLEKIVKDPGSLIIGARNMAQVGIPSKSSFGNKFSSFWFRIETTKKIPDTQSGFRLYPVKALSSIRFYTNKYEFEIEVLVRASWKGIRIVHIPIHVYYAEKEKRISHFRPFRDFVRISMLNTVLVTLALLYFIPLLFFKSITVKNIKHFIKNDLINSKDSNLRITLSVMLGTFMAITPIWGWQFLIAITLAYFFRLNKVIVAATSNFSIPPMMPIILYLSYVTGGLVVSGNHQYMAFDSSINFDFIKTNIMQYIIGSLVFGAAFSLFCGVLTFILMRVFRRREAKARHLKSAYLNDSTFEQ